MLALAVLVVGSVVLLLAWSCCRIAAQADARRDHALAGGVGPSRKEVAPEREIFPRPKLGVVPMSDVSVAPPPAMPRLQFLTVDELLGSQTSEHDEMEHAR